MELSGKTFEKNGENFEIRFFDPDSFFDLRDLREIVQSPGVQQWMSSVRNMSHKQYRNWMLEKGQDGSFLFAIVGKDQRNPNINRVHGFIYFYPSTVMSGATEISYAKRPGAPGGLIPPATRLAMQIIREKVGEINIIGEIERGNDASIQAIEKAGFQKYKDFDRHGNALWKLDWTKI